MLKSYSTNLTETKDTDYLLWNATNEKARHVPPIGKEDGS